MVTGVGASILGRLGRVSSVQPFTYSDADTFLRQLTALAAKVNEVITALDASQDGVDAVAAAVAASEARTLKALADLRAEVYSLVHDAVATGTAVDPTSGQIRTVQGTIDRVYDYLRVFVPFVGEEDAAEQGAAAMDAAEQPARRMDLAPRPLTVHDYDDDDDPVLVTG